MSRIYDNWDRLVGAVLKREELRRLALCESFSSSISTDFSSRFSFEDVSGSRISSDTIDPTASSSSSNLLSHREVKPIKLTEIKKATKNFHRDLLLGEGGFGPVFKGWIHEDTLSAAKPGFGMAVAVKKLRPESMQGGEEWSKEVNYLSRIRHPNIIELIGYCSEDNNQILVYEFMSKGSFNNHLFRRGHQSLSWAPRSLSWAWATRIKVAKDVARGLSFLHDMEIPVIHRGFNAGDILLDGEFNAKLSDFGLGTYGYAAPEYMATGHLTTKCDVYGFGVVLLQLLSGRRVIDISRVVKEQNLVKWAKPYLGNKRKLLRVMDTKLEGQYSVDGARKVAVLALQCLSSVPKRRPRMSEALAALEQLNDLVNAESKGVLKPPEEKRPASTDEFTVIGHMEDID